MVAAPDHSIPKSWPRSPLAVAVNVLRGFERGPDLGPGRRVVRDGRPDPDTAVACLPERPVHGAAGPGRRVVRLREVGEDEVLETVRGQRQRGLGRLPVREVAVRGGDPALEVSRVRPRRSQSWSWFASSTTASAPRIRRKTSGPASPRSVASATAPVPSETLTPVGQRVVGHLEEGRLQAADLACLPGLDRVARRGTSLRRGPRRPRRRARARGSGRRRCGPRGRG